ncbi:stage II sporulation protein M [Natronococcus wangiae]|uniref:stage II sporulation protein M n=1 Tax=Natronococcus wangiae TaxID=3068275 RepID=UPI00273DA92E|nr:stage II sporulation protein M [Natronococcus sp. AD5]
MDDRRTDDRATEAATDSGRRERDERSSAEPRESSDAGAGTPPSSPPSEPDAGPSGEADPGGEAGRGWASLAFALALVSLATAGSTAAVHDAALAAAGAAALALGFGALGALALTGGPGVAAALAGGWAEHRRYVWFATALFAGGVVIGGALVAAGVDLTELFLETLMEEFDEEEFAGGGGEIELSASFFIAQNTPPFLVAILGGLTLGLVTALIMVFNGVLVGNLAIVTGLEVGFGPIVALLVPHGIFELPALFIASGVGFRFLHRTVQRIAGSRDSLFTRAYLYRTTLLVVFGWLLLALAAFVEAYLTTVIAEALFPQLGE